MKLGYHEYMNLNVFNVFVYLSTAILASLLGLSVYLHNKQKKVNILFGIYIFSLLIWILTNFLTDAITNIEYTLLFAKLTFVGPLIVAPTLLHLSLIFPKNSPLEKNKIVMTLIWGIPLSMLFLVPTRFNVESVKLHDWGAEFVPGLLYIPYTVILVIYVCWAARNFIHYTKDSSAQIRSQGLLISLGALATLITALIVSIILPFLGFSRIAILAPSSTLFLFGAIGLAIIKHKFLDINLLIFRTVTYSLLILIVVITFSLGLFTLLQFIPEEYQIITSSLLALVLVFTFNPLKSFIEKITKNIFYKESYSSEVLLESLGSILRSTLSINTLTNNTLTELCDTMHITQAAYFLKTREDKFIPRSHGYKSTPELSSTAIQNLISAVDNELLIFDQLEESAIKMLMRQNNISIVIPLRVKSTYHGILILGEKASGEIYSSQDIDILEIFAPQISIAIQNALSYDEIKHFADTLKNEVEIATHELKAANRHLKHLDRLKNEFIFIATHELKNPVTAMRGYLSMLNEGLFGKIPEKMQEPLTQLNSSNQQLVELVNDLLQIARSEAKTLTIHSEVVDVCSLVDVICGNLKALADQKKITFNHSCSNPEKLTVNADPQRVKEILNNLISNAIKYSDRGTITITHELQDSMVVTHVTDQGVGISASDQKKLFTRFFRVEAEAAKGIPGTGLGLYIIKQIIEKMGGTIWLKSEVNKGSTFSFSLPKAN